MTQFKTVEQASRERATKPPPPAPPRDILPPEARQRLTSLLIERDSAQAAIASALNRIDQLRRGLSYADQTAESQPELAAELEQLEMVRTAQAARHRDLADLCAAVESWLRRLPRGVELQLAGPLPDRGDLTTVRAQIAEAKQTIKKVKASPPSRQELRDKVAAYVEELAASCRSTIEYRNGKVTARFEDRSSLYRTEAQPMAILAWAAKDAILEKLLHQVDGLDLAGGLSDADKQTKLAESEAALLALERLEEGIIRRSERGGAVILRRPDAAVCAVLNLK